VASSMRCMDAGATILGGCCSIGPSYIKALADATQDLQ
jgi:S-methylmethionine-dependent homocysteine/selenocysteine methylase